MKSLEQFLESLPAGGPERRYHQALVTILGSIDFDATDVNVGIGLMAFLDVTDFRGAGIDTPSDPVAGSRHMAGLFVAHCFAALPHHVEWWKSEALTRADREEVVRWREWWHKQFASSQLVEHVYGLGT